MADETPPQPDQPPKRVYKKRGIYKPKNGLDLFLRAHIGGKYKHRRYAIYKDLLMRAHNKTSAEADQIIENYKTKGVPSDLYFYSTAIEELRIWKQMLRKERADKAIAARWKKKNQNSEQK
jgi:hypothetical protein